MRAPPRALSIYIRATTTQAGTCGSPPSACDSSTARSTGVQHAVHSTHPVHLPVEHDVEDHGHQQAGRVAIYGGQCARRHGIVCSDGLLQLPAAAAPAAAPGSPAATAALCLWLARWRPRSCRRPIDKGRGGGTGQCISAVAGICRPIIIRAIVRFMVMSVAAAAHVRVATYAAQARADVLQRGGGSWL